MSKRNLIFLWIAAVLLLLGGYGWIFGFATWTMIADRRLARENPSLVEVPKQLTDLRQSPAQGPKLSYMGYTFRTPWGEVDWTKQKLMPTFAAVTFKSGAALVIFGGAGTKGGLEDQELQKSLQPIFGDDVYSGYNFTKAQLETVPGHTGLFTPKQELVRHSMLLLMKAVTSPVSGPVYYVQTGEMRGFQYGDPGNKLMVQLFGDSRRVEIAFPKQVNGIPISQADVNCVIQSLRPVDPAQSAKGK